MIGVTSNTTRPGDSIDSTPIFGIGGSNQLDDTDIEIGTITNAGAGWNTFKFREKFEGVPVVTVSAQEFPGYVEIKSIDNEGFLYCLRVTSLTPGTVTASGMYIPGVNNILVPVSDTLVPINRFMNFIDIYLQKGVGANADYRYINLTI